MLYGSLPENDESEKSGQLLKNYLAERKIWFNFVLPLREMGPVIGLSSGSGRVLKDVGFIDSLTTI